MRINLIIIMPTLYDLNINTAATISSFKNSIEFSARLSEMGIIPGSMVRVVKKNPFGGPVQIKLNDYYLAIRKEDAELIYISK